MILQPHKGFCDALALYSLLKKKSPEIICHDWGGHTTIVVQLMGMLIFIINDGTSGQSACDCGQGWRLQGDVLDRECQKQKSEEVKMKW